MAKSNENLNLRKENKLMESIASSISLSFDLNDIKDFHDQRLSLSSDEKLSNISKSLYSEGLYEA